MTPQEQQMLQGLTERINGTVLTDKDPEAEQYIFEKLGRNSDSLYILAQTVLVQQYALDQAKNQLDDLRRQPTPPAPEKHTSFLGNLLGLNDDPTPPPPPLARPGQGQAQYGPVPNYPQQGYPQQGYPQQVYTQQGYTQAAPMASQGGGFLRSAMQTATGVAAGALAFQGIESLMHGFGQHAGYGSGFGDFGGGSGGGRGETINNYYGDSGGGRSGGISPDVEDRRDNSSQFAGNADNTLADNDPDDFGDTSSSDDTSSADELADNDPDDFGSSDDSSSSDDSNS